MGGVRPPEICDKVATGILLVSSDYVIKDANMWFLKKLGMNREAVLGRSILDFLEPENRDVVRNFVNEALDGGEPSTIVKIWNNRRENVWVYMTFNALGENVLVTVVDISRFVNTQQRLESKNDELKTIYNFANAIGGTLDLEKIYEIAYRELSRIVSRMDAFIIAVVDDSQRWLNIEFIVGKSKRYEKHRIPMNDNDSLTGWVAVNGRELYIRDIERDEFPAKFNVVGSFMRSWLGIPLIYRDRILGVMSVQSEYPDAFSERDLRILRLIAMHLAMVIYNARLYCALRESEERYRNLVNTSLVGIFTMDMEYRITFVNDTLAKMMGFEKEELLGRNVMEFVDESAYDAVRKGMERRKKGLSDTYEAEFKRKNGSTIPVIIYASPLRDNAGNIIGTLAAIADISNLKKLENEIRESKELQELLLHTVSHDLKTPLSVIVGYVDLLRKEIRGEYLDAIDEAVRDALSLIEKIQLLSRLDVGRMNEALEEYELGEVIDGAISFVRKKYPEVDLSVSGASVRMEGYPALMREVFINLLLNSFKYGATEVRINIEPSDSMVRIRIADNGPGIRDDRKRVVFDPFVKFSSGGSGLGLFIVRRVVELHGGRIWIEDNEPRGSVFIIEMPIK